MLTRCAPEHNTCLSRKMSLALLISYLVIFSTREVYSLVCHRSFGRNWLKQQQIGRSVMSALKMSDSVPSEGNQNATQAEVQPNYFGIDYSELQMEKRSDDESLAPSNNPFTVARIPSGPDDLGDDDVVLSATASGLAKYKNINNQYFRMVDKLQPNEMLLKVSSFLSF